jgi:hypothetical protein
MPPLDNGVPQHITEEGRDAQIVFSTFARFRFVRCPDPTRFRGVNGLITLYNLQIRQRQIPEELKPLTRVFS